MIHQQHLSLPVIYIDNNPPNTFQGIEYLNKLRECLLSLWTAPMTNNTLTELQNVDRN